MAPPLYTSRWALKMHYKNINETVNFKLKTAYDAEKQLYWSLQTRHIFEYYSSNTSSENIQIRSKHVQVKQDTGMDHQRARIIREKVTIFNEKKMLPIIPIHHTPVLHDAINPHYWADEIFTKCDTKLWQSQTVKHGTTPQPVYPDPAASISWNSSTHIAADTGDSILMPEA